MKIDDIIRTISNFAIAREHSVRVEPYGVIEFAPQRAYSKPLRPEHFLIQSGDLLQMLDEAVAPVGRTARVIKGDDGRIQAIAFEPRVG